MILFSIVPLYFIFIISILLKPTATPEELNCPVGTKRETVGAGADTDCAVCDAGYYCVEGSTDETGPCDPGFYCPTSFTNPYGASPPTIGSYGAQQVLFLFSPVSRSV